MEAKDIFLHEFWTNYISGKKHEKQFYNKLKLILKYSLVSHNYYDKFIKEKEGDFYKQSTPPIVQGYSTNYVSLIDPQFLEQDDGKKYFMQDILDFLENQGSYIVVKRDRIENFLSENKESFTPMQAPKPTIHKAFDKAYVKANRTWVANNCGNWHEALTRYGMEYVLAGEVKVRDRIPLEEITALAFGRNFIEGQQQMEVVEKVLNDIGKPDFPLYLIENELGNNKLKSMKLTRL